MHLLEGKYDYIDITNEIEMSIQTIKDYSANLRKFGDILPPKTSQRDHPSLLIKAMIKVCILSTLNYDFVLIYYIDITRLY